MMTPRDEQILTAITRKARMIAPVQAAQTWWPRQRFATQSAHRRLRHLAADRWVTEFQVLAQPLLELARPILTWEPGMGAPDFRALSSVLARRSQQPAQRVSVYVPTPSTLRFFGCSERPSIHNDCQVTHDLHVTQVYLRYLVVDRSAAERWHGEDLLEPVPHRSQPDALLLDDTGAPVRAIEFGGRYTADRLAKLHKDCALQNLPYEVW